MTFPICSPACRWCLMFVVGALASSVSVSSAQTLEVVQNKFSILVRHNGKAVVTYNTISPPAPKGIDTIYQRSGCLHPVRSPAGRTVTAMFPVDHPHQHGIFSAWVRTRYGNRQVDFWNLAGGTGRVLHERVVSTFQDAKAAGFEVDLLHRAEANTKLMQPAVDVLRERWKISVYPTDGSYHCFDLDTEQTALTDVPLVISKYHYGGIVLRGPTRWLTDKDNDVRNRPDLVREPSALVNDHGSDRFAGNHQRAKWVALTGQQGGEPVSVAVLCHADNFRAPQAARLHPTKPYFCFAPCVEGAFTIDRDHPFRGRYRYLITDAKPDAQWINQQWQAWCTMQ